MAERYLTSYKSEWNGNGWWCVTADYTYAGKRVPIDEVTPIAAVIPIPELYRVVEYHRGTDRQALERLITKLELEQYKG